MLVRSLESLFFKIFLRDNLIRILFKNNRHEVLLFFLTRLRDEVGSNSIDLINLISQPDLNNRSAIDIATAAGYEQCISLLNNYLL